MEVVSAGVYDALKQKYLKCLLFGISEDERGSCLMEVSSTAAQSDQGSQLRHTCYMDIQQCPMQQCMQ